MNKILGLAAGVSMLALVAMPAMARDHDWNNTTHVTTTVTTSANTGGNNTTVIGGNNSGYNSYHNLAGVATGNANAQTLVLTGANVNFGGSDDHSRFSGAHVTTTVTTSANTGNNYTNIVGGNNQGHNSNNNFTGTSTGNAGSRTAVVNVVNTNISF